MNAIANLFPGRLPSEIQAAVALAVAIADDSARSDIEIYAKGQAIPAEHGGYWIYSLTETVAVTESPKFTLDDALDALRLTQRGAKYIRERGNAFAWRMVDADGYPGYVRFIDKEGRPVDPGAQA